MIKKKYKDKPAIVTELHDKLNRASAVVVTEYRGLKAGDLVKLRRSLRESEVELVVVKNTLLRRAADGTPMADALGELDGPKAVAMAFGGPVVAAKALAEGEKTLDSFVLLRGFLEDMAVDGEKIAAIAKLPSQDELRAKALGALQGPLANLVFTLQGVLQQFAGTLQAKVEKEGGAEA
jgi:large subunit ribosomal protein L10